MSSLTIVRPVTVTDSILVSSDVPETDYSTWSSGTTYALGDRVILTHKIYESLQASNTNHPPATEPAWWAEVSYTNRWKIFDGSRSTQTAQADAIEYVLAPGAAISTVAALNLTNCTSVQIQLQDATYGLVYNNTFDLSPVPATAAWYDWFFGERTAPSIALFEDLPAYPNATMTVNFVGGTSLAVGVLLFGQDKLIGMGLNAGARIGITDYSRKEVNEWGDTVLVQRAFSKRATFDMLLRRAEVDTVAATLAELRAVPCLWIGSIRYESTILYGYYKTFDISISYPDFSECALDIEGLT